MLDVAVGRVAKAHGIRGEVSVHVMTDDPTRRFRVGSRLSCGTTGPVTIASVRRHQGRLLVRFAEHQDRAAAEALVGRLLTVTLTAQDESGEPDAWYDHQLEGLQARLTTGEVVGTVAAVEHGTAQDLLVIECDGRRALVPFVTAIVPEVDVPAGFLVLDPPGGLLDDLAGS